MVSNERVGEGSFHHVYSSLRLIRGFVQVLNESPAHFLQDIIGPVELIYSA